MPLGIPALLRRPALAWRLARRLAWWMSGITAALLLNWWQPAFVQRLDLLAYDLMLPERRASAQAPVVVAIDDASLAAIGRWPWPRGVHAAMVDRLREAGVARIGMAVLFAEPDRRDPGGDAALADAVRRHGRVVMAAAPARQPDGRIDATPLQPPWQAVQAMSGAEPSGSTGLGHVDVEIDLDGRSRGLFLWAGAGRADLPALASALLGPAPLPPDTARATPAVGTWLRRDETLLPRTTGLPTLPFAQLLSSPQLLDGLQGQTVFIGITAAGLGAELDSPLSAQRTPLPAVMFHAQAFDALQSHAVIRRAPSALVLALGLFTVCGLALWPVHFGRRALSAGLLLGLPLALSAALMATAMLWLPPTAPTLALAVALAGWFTRRLRQAKRQLMRTRQHAQATLNAIDDAVLTIDARTPTVHFANPAALRQAGGRPLTGLPLEAAYPLTLESMQRLSEAVDTCLHHQRRVHVDAMLTLLTRAGPRALRATASPLHSPEGRLDGAVLVFADVTDTLAAARELDRAASHDTLTGLPNRSLLHERLTLALSRVQRRGSTAAILFLDLDRFKHINDSLGHRMGDEVLKILSRRLCELCGDSDTVARWGGDEFVLILEDIGDREAAAIAAARVVDALSQDIELDTGFNHVRLPSACSVGVVLAPQDGTEIEDLLAKADMAMYRAKAQPRAGFHFWSNEINTRLHDRLALEIELRRGLREDQFVLHYQPQFGLQDHRLVGLEALMRWQRTPAQLVQPGEFIEVAEESDLIVDLGAWAVRQAARQQAAWLRAGLAAVPVAVNISARQCVNRDLVQVVRQALAETGIPPRLLRLEITETTAMTDADQVIGLLEEVRALGVGLSVDDFGTGYSSLAYLKRFPIDELKIDRSFVQDLAEDAQDAAIVRATIVLAHGLGLKVVAEGVETDGQRRFLAAHGCDTAQGFLFGRPLTLPEVTRRLA